MSPEITRKRFTYDDCVRMEEVGILSPAEKVELLNGELFLMSPPGPRHGTAVDGTAAAIMDLARGKAIVRVQGGVVLDIHAAPLPDIAVLAPKVDRYVTKNPAAPDILLIVEVSLSSLEHDTNTKLQVYAITGIREYWVADLNSNRLLVYTDPSGDSYQKVREFHRGDTIAPHLLPDCRISVDLLLP